MRFVLEEDQECPPHCTKHRPWIWGRLPSTSSRPRGYLVWVADRRGGLGRQLFWCRILYLEVEYQWIFTILVTKKMNTIQCENFFTFNSFVYQKHNQQWFNDFHFSLLFYLLRLRICYYQKPASASISFFPQVHIIWLKIQKEIILSINTSFQ